MEEKSRYAIETTDGEVLVEDGYYTHKELLIFVHNLYHEFDMIKVGHVASIPNKIIVEHKDMDKRRKENLMYFIMEKMDKREQALLLAFLSNRCKKIELPQIQKAEVVYAVVRHMKEIRKAPWDFRDNVIEALRKAL